jgi:hypothetical protein
LSTIYPTHTCFDDALETMAAFVQHDRRRIETLVLVHGVCVNPINGELYAHAWLEEHDRAWHAGHLGGPDGPKVIVEASRAELRVGLQVQEETRYSVLQAHLANYKSNHFGPWVERYRELCKDSAPEIREAKSA